MTIEWLHRCFSLIPELFICHLFLKKCLQVVIIRSRPGMVDPNENRCLDGSDTASKLGKSLLSSLFSDRATTVYTVFVPNRSGRILALTKCIVQKVS